MENKNLFRLEHIRDCIEKIEYLMYRLDTQDNFEMTNSIKVIST